MPATLASLTSKTRTLAIAIDDDPEAITVVYRPRAMTAAVMAEIEDAIARNLATRSIFPAIRALLIEWDLRSDADEPVIPLTDEGLARVPIDVLGLVIAAVVEDLSPKPTIGTVSPRPSDSQKTN